MENSQGLGVALPILVRHYARLEGSNLKDRRLYMRLYMRVWRFVKSLERDGYVELKKVGGLTWIKPKPAVVDLIQSVSSSQTPVSKSGELRESVNKLALRGHPARVDAAVLLLKRRVLREQDWRELYGLLEEYCDDVSKRVIVLARVGDETQVMLLRYEHRFTPKRLAELLELYESLWEFASSRFHVGVFITLTMDPKTYGSLYEASRKISKAFNRFMSFLAKRLGFRPPYIAVLEPMDNGNLHLHVVIFGVSRLADHFELTPILRKQGFGQIHFEYRIVKKGGVWVWAGGSPSGASSVKDYLKKYLKKLFEVQLYGDSTPSAGRVPAYMKISFYFAANKRFFTYSVKFFRIQIRPRVRTQGGWRFVGSWYIWDVPDWVLEAAGVSLVPDPILGWAVVQVVGPP